MNVNERLIQILTSEKEDRLGRYNRMLHYKFTKWTDLGWDSVPGPETTYHPEYINWSLPVEDGWINVWANVGNNPRYCANNWEDWPGFLDSRFNTFEPDPLVLLRLYERTIDSSWLSVYTSVVDKRRKMDVLEKVGFQFTVLDSQLMSKRMRSLDTRFSESFISEIKTPEGEMVELRKLSILESLIDSLSVGEKDRVRGSGNPVGNMSDKLMTIRSFCRFLKEQDEELGTEAYRQYKMIAQGKVKAPEYMGLPQKHA